MTGHLNKWEISVEYKIDGLNLQQAVFLQLAFSAAGQWDTEELATATEYVMSELADKPKDTSHIQAIK